MSRYIDKVGIELEGGWNGTPGISPFDFPLKQDISIHGIPGATHIGEAASEPLELGEWEAWVAKHYPDFPQNAGFECGLHVHVSVKSEALYRQLATREYFDHFLAEMGSWARREELPPDHPFWPRFEGKNRFCYRKFNPQEQMKLKDKRDERRSVLNYCWSMHKTMENRLLPMFAEGAPLAIRAIRAFLSSVDGFLFTREHILAAEEVVDVSKQVGLGTPTRIGEAAQHTLGNLRRLNVRQREPRVGNAAPTGMGTTDNFAELVRRAGVRRRQN